MVIHGMKEVPNGYKGNHSIKNIINGTTYNTDTSICLHLVGNEERMVCVMLWMTRMGAYFKLLEDMNEGYSKITPLTPQEAEEWLEKVDAPVKLMEQLFGEFPEAGSNERQLTIRIPEIIYNHLAKMAESKGQSLNSHVTDILYSTIELKTTA